MGEKAPVTTLAFELERDYGRARSPRSLTRGKNSLSRPRVFTRSDTSYSINEEEEETIVDALHLIDKEGKTSRDKRIEVLATSQAQLVGEFRLLLECYLVPLHRAVASDGSLLIVNEGFDALCMHLNSVFEVHRKFSEDLDARLASWKKSGEELGDLLLRFGDLLRNALLFVYNPENEFATISGWRSDSRYAKEVDALLRAAEKSTALSLKEALMVPSKKLRFYQDIIEEVLVHTPDGHRDREPLKKAVVIFHDLLDAQMRNAPNLVRSGTKTLSRPNSQQRGLFQKNARSASSSMQEPEVGTTQKAAESKAATDLKAFGARISTKWSNTLSKSSRHGGDGAMSPSKLSPRSEFGPITPSSSSSSPVATAEAREIESMTIQEALAKLLSPVGCEEEFEGIFLGMHHYFISWAMLLRRFRDAYESYLSETAPKRQQYMHRLVQVVTKWLRVNPGLRQARLTEDEMAAELALFTGSGRGSNSEIDLAPGGPGGSAHSNSPSPRSGEDHSPPPSPRRLSAPKDLNHSSSRGNVKLSGERPITDLLDNESEEDVPIRSLSPGPSESPLSTPPTSGTPPDLTTPTTRKGSITAKRSSLGPLMGYVFPFIFFFFFASFLIAPTSTSVH